MLNLATIGYVPPPQYGCSRSFMENIRAYKTKFPLILYSEYDYGTDVIRIKASPEIVKQRPDCARFSINNFCFFTGLRIARAHGLTHVIYLESDVRVMGDEWDGKIFEEYFNLPTPKVMGGSTIIWNPANAGMESLRRFDRLVKEHNTLRGPVPGEGSNRNFPIPCYGWKKSDDTGGTCVFSNGAGAVYDMAWMEKFYDLENTQGAAIGSTAWDQQNGFHLWSLLGQKSYDAVGYLSSLFSSYGDTLTTEHERLEMLRNGDKVLIHQCKSNKLP